jgi:acyl homoserine lactone synthase
MLFMVTPDRYGRYLDEITEMHRLRYRVFKERLGWDVEVSGGLEVDEYDSLSPTYLIQRSDDDGRIQGCIRLLPTTGPTMLRDAFPILLGGKPAPNDARIWESSRFSLDISPDAPKGAKGVSCATYELFAALQEFGLSRGLTHILTVTDIRVERILRQAEWPFERISPPQTIGNTRAVAGFGAVSVELLMRMRAHGNLAGPVLFEEGTAAVAA